MHTEREVSRMFIRYVQSGLRNERINIYYKQQRQVAEILLETPPETQLLEYIFNTEVSTDDVLTVEDISHLEAFFENDILSEGVATLNFQEKLLLYQYYIFGLNDGEIGVLYNKTSQGIGKRRQRVLSHLKSACESLAITGLEG